jgi:hypothetical protein
MIFIGGLEFDAVIIVWVDDGRVLPKNNDEVRDSFSLYELCMA